MGNPNYTFPLEAMFKNKAQVNGYDRNKFFIIIDVTMGKLMNKFALVAGNQRKEEETLEELRQEYDLYVGLCKDARQGYVFNNVDIEEVKSILAKYGKIQTEAHI